MPDSTFPAQLAAREAEIDGWIKCDDRREALRLAEVRLMQSEACRIGYLRDAFVRDAADLLRRAGRADLADRLEDDAWGGDTAAMCWRK